MTIITKNERLEGLLNNNDLPHNEKYEAIIEELGYENVKKCLSFSIEELTTAYENDKNFNNIPLKKWDLAGGFITETTAYQQTYRQVNSPLAELLIANRISSLSPSTAVCILKNCARMYVEKEQEKQQFPERD